MTNQEIIDSLERFKSGLSSKATDGSIDESEYRYYRKLVMETSKFKNHIPTFIKSNKTSSEFRRYMQAEHGGYKERREFIAQEINKLIDILENQEEDPFLNINKLSNLESLGEGGFGQVYKYYNEYLDMNFAVKIYNPIFMSNDEQKEGEKRFFREAKMMFKLSSDYIARIFDAGRYEDKPYIKMEYIEGYDLYKLVEKYGFLSFEKSKKVISDILKGLIVAHQNNIVHRDLKPSNILFDSKEKNFKIIDFGVSAFLDIDNYTKLTKTGEFLAGGSFIDPLLQVNPKLRDCRVDIYSVGAIWYYLLCEKAPSGSDMKETLASMTNLSQKRLDFIFKCLSSNIDNRFSSCELMLSLLEEI